MTRRPVRRPLLGLALFALLVGVPYALLVLVGWAGLGHGGGGEAAPPAIAGDQAATVAIVSPAAGAAVTGRRIRVRVRVDGRLGTPRGAAAARRAAHVHLHFQLDGGRYDTPAHSDSRLMALERSSGSYSGSVSPRISYRDVAPGPHVLRVEIVAEDHRSGGEIGGDAVAFRTRERAPALRG